MHNFSLFFCKAHSRVHSFDVHSLSYGEHSYGLVWLQGCEKPSLQSSLSGTSLLSVGVKSYQGELKSVFGRKVVCLDPEANYAGGSRQLWAVEGVQNKATSQRWEGYKRITCKSIDETTGNLIFLDASKNELALELSDIRRFDF